MTSQHENFLGDVTSGTISCPPYKRDLLRSADRCLNLPPDGRFGQLGMGASPGGRFGQLGLGAPPGGRFGQIGPGAPPGG